MENAIRPRLAAGEYLFETFGVDDGGHTPRLSMHLERLCRSARVFGIQFDIAKAHRLIDNVTDARVKLKLLAHGEFELEIHPRPEAVDCWRVGFSSVVIDETDIFYQHKTSRRRVYDKARASLSEGVDEVIFTNQAGHLTEGTISNLFVNFGDGLITPPISDGVLPGVLRRELIAQKAARVSSIRACDLKDAKAVYMGNSLRGLVRVDFVNSNMTELV